jgi:hypothetical protein
LNSANPVCKRPQLPSFWSKSLRGGTDRSEDRKSAVPPPGPPLHHHCFDVPKAGAVSFPRLPWRVPRRKEQKPACATPCGRWKLHKPSSPLTVFTAPSSCPLVANVKIRSAPDRSCLCEVSLPGNRSTGLLDLLSSSKPSIRYPPFPVETPGRGEDGQLGRKRTAGEEALATDRFQYATSKDVCSCSARRPIRARFIMEDELR